MALTKTQVITRLKRLLQKDNSVRKARKLCPNCGFEWFLAGAEDSAQTKPTSEIEKVGFVYCAWCRLMVPNNIVSLKTGKRVRF